MFRKIKRIVKSYCYDRIQEHSAGTPILYKKALNILSPGSSILEIGIGNGICIKKNANYIKKKNLKIKGIDIDQEYLEVCKQRIDRNGLNNNVSCHSLDLLTIDESEKYDYILYSGSYPVISGKLMDLMLSKSKKLLRNKDSNIIFSHSLYIEEKNVSLVMLNALNFVKKNLKYVPLIWTDFGRMTTVSGFDNMLAKHNLLVVEKIIIGTATERTQVVKKYLLQLIRLTFKSEHYIYKVRVSFGNGKLGGK